jgi:hypothetical protein
VELEQYPKCGTPTCPEFPGIDGVCCRIITQERLEAAQVQRDFTWMLEMKSQAEMEVNPQFLRCVLHYDPLTEAGRRIGQLVNSLSIEGIA